MGVIFQITNLAEFAMLLLMHFLLVFCYHALLSRQGKGSTLTILKLDRARIMSARAESSQLIFQKKILQFFMKYHRDIHKPRGQNFGYF